MILGGKVDGRVELGMDVVKAILELELVFSLDKAPQVRCIGIWEKGYRFDGSKYYLSCLLFLNSIA